ncbi:MAG: hypothetical protein RL557_31 [archaeon]|jgi:hypothetical protein
MYALKKVAVNESRTGYFVYDSSKISDDPASGFVKGFVVKQKDGKYAVFKATDAYNFGIQMTNLKTEEQANTIAQHQAEELLKKLYRAEIEKKRTSRAKRESLELIAA